MNIAVFLPNWVGDVVMATPAVRALREHYRDARLIGVLKPYVAGVLQGAPWLDGQLFLDSSGPWTHRWPAVARALPTRRVDEDRHPGAARRANATSRRGGRPLPR